MRYFIILITAGCLLGIPIRSFASDLFTKIAFETRHSNGDSTYHISFDDTWENGGHGESEVEFPLASTMAGVSLAVGNRHEKKPNLTKSQFCLTWLGVVSQAAGTMKDSDWIENDAAFGQAPHTGKDLYTESDAKLQGTIYDIQYAYHFSLTNSLTLGPIIGFRYQEFEYDIYGYRGKYWTTPVSGEGKVLEYRITYKIPYTGLSSDFLFGKNKQFQLHLTFVYSDWAKADDRDNHVLRYKLLEGDCEGEAYLINLNLDWKCYARWVLSLGAEYVDIETGGRQHQSYYAGPYKGITYDADDRITSSSWSSILRICYAF
ncbi:MAG TPA: omptin family outer membrane protease [Desulfatiglandales bacterium]|nr:omptin family outer membrane protease [Desulfatiglandales bacterium]